MQVLPYNRVVKDLGGHSPQSLLAKLREQDVVKEGPAMPARKGEVAMFLDGKWHTLALGAGPRDVSPADRLDVSRLQDTRARRRCSASATSELTSGSISSAALAVRPSSNGS